VSRDIGTRERLNPSFYVDDPEATILAEYQGTGVPSLAVKNCGDWKSIFVGDPVLPVDLLRGICRFADVHVWTPQGDDVIDIGNGYVTVHAAKEGQRAIRLPDATGLYDITESRHIADEIREHRFYMRVGDTRSFCVGSAERFINIGLPNVAPPGAGRSRMTTTAIPSQPPQSEVHRASVPPQRPRNSDIETLEAVLNMDISDLNGIELEALPDEPIEFIFMEGGAKTQPDTQVGAPDTTGEVIAGGRRRRRRGGRGRGRRRPGEGADDIASITEPGAVPTDETPLAGNQDESVIPTVGYVDVRNSISEKSVWAPEYQRDYDREMEQSHADSGSSTHGEGDASL
jgi:hypothetical protein